MPFCEKCGCGQDNDSKFCPSCGAPTNNAPIQQAQQVQPPVYPNQPPVSHQSPLSNIPNYNPMAITEREPHMMFMFVTSLVFMIFLITRSISAIATIGDWKEISVFFPETALKAYISIGATIVTCIATITFFVLATMSKSRHKPIADRIKLSKALFVFSIIALICSICYIVTESLLVSDVYSIVNFDTEQLSMITGSLAFNAVYIIFASINIWRAHAFGNYLKRLPSQQ